MAQLVKLEPGDTLVLSNLGELGEDPEDFAERIEWIRERLQLESVMVFAGDVDLSKVRTRDAP